MNAPTFGDTPTATAPLRFATMMLVITRLAVARRDHTTPDPADVLYAARFGLAYPELFTADDAPAPMLTTQEAKA